MKTAFLGQFLSVTLGSLLEISWLEAGRGARVPSSDLNLPVNTIKIESLHAPNF